MSANPTGRAALPIGGGRRFREAWSLAAGAGPEPRVGVIFALVVAAAVIAVEAHSPFGGSRHFGSEVGPWIVAFAYPSWLLISLAGREMRRRAGERGRRRHDGAVRWRDRDWPTAGVSRPIADGMPGMRAPVALSIVATAVVVAGMLFLAEGRGMYMSANNLGWMPAPAYVVVAMYSLPLMWLCVVVVPRLGRGRLVVTWPTFPQITGSRCGFHVGTSPGGASIDGARVFPRCVRIRSREFLPLAVWNSRLVWVGEAHLPLSARCGPESDLRAEFDVPSNLPQTNLHAADTVRWEVLVVGRVGVTDYADSVIVPVYAPAP